MFQNLMQLDRAQIKNYRSIAEIKINFEPKCRILVGINESGKTNILDALNLLDPDATTTRRDLREPGLNEEPVAQGFVRFIFRLSKEETSDLLTDVKMSVLSKSYKSPIIRLGDRDLTLHELCETREGLHVSDTIKGKKYNSTWSFGDSTILNKWKKVRDDCPKDFAIPGGDKAPALASYTIVDTSEFPEIPGEYVEEATPEDLHSLVKEAIVDIIAENLPEVRFWTYDEKKILPPRINLEQFCLKPDTCLPLRRMFELHGIVDIAKEVTAARAGGANSLSNLLRRIAQSASRHFHNTWREYDGIKFSLTTDGPDLIAAIEDESNHYELSQRSDGFKRFVSFLLLVSAEDESHLLKNTLLLIDEPEIGLHPTGARYLMEELIDISKNNYVVFSTHSIFMVDNHKINRHLIVRKKKEITEIEQVSESNLQDEEVIYKSLGYSIFSNLREKNLIFEGWRDKKLFETAISHVPGPHELVKRLKTAGRCFAPGVKEIHSITPLFEAGQRKCLILSDCDAVAKEHQKRYQQNHGYGIWKRYDEILDENRARHVITGEDFLKVGTLQTAVEQIRDKYGLPENVAIDFNRLGGRIAAIKHCLSGLGVPPETVAAFIEELKDNLFDNLKYSDIEDEYYTYLEQLVPIYEGL